MIRTVDGVSVREKSSEERLWSAFMLQNIKDLNAGFRDAKDWFMDDSYKVGSFRWVCGVIGVGPEYVRDVVTSRRLKFMGNWFVEVL